MTGVRMLLGVAAFVVTVPLLLPSPVSAAGPTPVPMVSPSCDNSMISGAYGAGNVSNIYRIGQPGISAGTFHNATKQTITGVDFDLQVAPNPTAGPIPTILWRVDSGSWRSLHMTAIAPTNPGDLWSWKSDDAYIGVDLAPGAVHTLSFQLTFVAGDPPTDASGIVDFGSTACGDGHWVVGFMPLWGWAFHPSGSTGGTGGVPTTQPRATRTGSPNPTTASAVAGAATVSSASSATVAASATAPISSASAPDSASASDAAVTSAPTVSTAPSPASDVRLGLAGSSASHGSALPYILTPLALVLAAGGYWAFRRRRAAAGQNPD